MSSKDAHVTIAPHLWSALEVMGRDMAVEPQALVNQAVFAWLRINGYVLPGTVHDAASMQPAAPPVSPDVATVAARPALVDVQARPTAPEPPPAPPRVETAAPASRVEPPAAAPRVESAPAARVEPPAAVPRVESAAPAARTKPPAASPRTEPAASSVRAEAPPAPARTETPAPSPRTEAPPVAPRTEARTAAATQLAPEASTAVDPEALAAVVSRIADIEADLARLARPRPAFKDEPADDDEVSEPESNDASDEEEDEAENEAAASSADEDAEAPGDDEEEPEVTDERTAAAAPDDELSEEDEAPPDDDEPEAPVEGTVVVRGPPVVLYIEREGEDVVRVEAEQFIIGRGPTCDLIIDSPRVSREHVRLSRQGARFVIEDLGSSNGTWLGEERVQQREVESGEEYLLGNEPVRLVLRGE